jgi:hypothetical protein
MLSHDKNFYLADGKILKTIKELGKSLRDMPMHIFCHHVRKDNNDFANWIRFSIGNINLAAKVEGQISKIELELEVLRHLLHDAKELEDAEKKVNSVSKKKTTSTTNTKKPVAKKTTKSKK